METGQVWTSVKKRFKITPALDWATSGSNGLFIYLFKEIYNNRINIYLEYIFRENLPLKCSDIFLHV